VDEGPEFDASFFKPVRQGFIFDVPDSGDGAQSLAVISQTCDVVLQKRPTLTFCKVATLEGDDLRQAQTGAIPRYVRLPLHGSDKFGDLSFIETYSKADVVDLPYSDGVGEELRRDFALAISRWFGRFAFPDAVVPWLRPLESLIQNKYRRNSSLGELLRTVVAEIRVEADWNSAPYKLTLHTIVKAEFVPTLPDDVAPASLAFLERLRTPDGDFAPPSALAEVAQSTGDPVEVNLALDALAGSFASACKPHPRHNEDATIMRAVESIEGQLWSDDDFPYSRHRKSEALDLEFLSEPESR
jgi:hypothetical protein